jgi:hypothetical protein
LPNLPAGLPVARLKAHRIAVAPLEWAVGIPAMLLARRDKAAACGTARRSRCLIGKILPKIRHSTPMIKNIGAINPVAP